MIKKLGDGARGLTERLDFVRALSLLSREQPPRALFLAERALASAQGGTLQRIVEAQAVLALALSKRRQFLAARGLAAKSLRSAEAAGSPAGVAFAKVARGRVGTCVPRS